MQKVRQVLSYAVSPIQSLIALPSGVANWSAQTFAERDALLLANRTLRSQLIILQQQSQQLSVLEAENSRLRGLLSATKRLDSRFLATELTSVDPDPFSIQVIINRGAQDGVYVGQSVVDATGLFGVVVQVDSFSSRVALIADANVAVPVYVNRTGIRSVIVGTGSTETLEMEFVPDTADIKIGDTLVTSGLAGRFPMGYPVAEVIDIENDPGEAFARIRSRPLAELGRSRNLLLVFQEGDQ